MKIFSNQWKKNKIVQLIESLLNHTIIHRRREVPFIIFASFLVSFIVARITVYLMEAHWGDVFALHVKGIHVHHFNYGIALVSIVGLLTLTMRSFTDKYIHYLAMFYGIGLGIMMDEFALFMRLDQEGYWLRYNYDAITVIGLILLNIVYFKDFWKSFGSRFKRLLRHFIN